LRAMEKRRNELEAQLMHSQRLEALGTLAGGIAHDLNNTMVPVVALAKRVAGHLPEGSRDRESLEIIHQAGLRSRELVQQILDFSRKTPAAQQPVNLSDLVRDSMHLIRATVPTTINIEHTEGSRLAPVLCDPGQLHQVLLNLVTNAAHAIGERIGTIAIEVTEARANEVASLAPPALGGVVLSVRDDGCGMDNATVRRIFEPFFTTKVVGQGTGLGLSVVHGIITAMGGRIEVESKRDIGTVFHVLLPTTSAPATSSSPA